MNIAIIGAGNVGGTLGTRWAKNGHKVTFGVRKPAGAAADKPGALAIEPAQQLVTQRWAPLPDGRSCRS